MQRPKLRSVWLIIGLIMAMLWLSLPVIPAGAQLFATNTPLPGQVIPPVSATATPAATVTLAVENTPVPAVTVSTPDAPIDNYPLRIWLERDMLNLLYDQIAALSQGGADARRALQLTAYEFKVRFPGAPTSTAERERLIQSMLAAPRGSIDMRWVIHPYLAAELNNRRSDSGFEFSGFRVDISSARFNPDETPDALIHILYPAGAAGEDEVLFEEYLLALRNPDGAFFLLPQAYDSPAAPFSAIRSVSLQRMEDVNRDSLDEVVLVVDDGQANARWWILGARNNQAVDLALPGQEIRVGELLSWEAAGDNPVPVLRIYHYQVESEEPDFPCLSQLPVTWEYQANFYRPAVALDAQYRFQDTLGCKLHAAEPIFAMSPEAGTALIETTLVEFSVDAPGGDRALLTLAMLYVLQGRLDEARAIAGAVVPAGETDTWAAKQSQALLEALGVSGNTALDICEALNLASVSAACDMDAVLGRYLGLATLKTDADLVEQLEALGFPVVEAVPVTEIGKASRIVVSFNLTGTGWWGFVAQRDGLYHVEKARPPTGFEAASLPAGLLDAPQTAYNALLINNNPEGTLTILDTLEQNNPDIPLSPAARYLKALSYDLAANRPEARRAYFDLWSTFPRSLWGQLAAKHLERR